MGDKINYWSSNKTRLSNLNFDHIFTTHQRLLGMTKQIETTKWEIDVVVNTIINILVDSAKKTRKFAPKRKTRKWFGAECKGVTGRADTTINIQTVQFRK